MFAQITYVELFKGETHISKNQACVKLIHQGDKVYHYEILYKGEIMLFDDNFKNKGYLYVRSDRDHGFIVNNTIENHEKLERMIISVAPDADVDKHILNLPEHGLFY